MYPKYILTWHYWEVDVKVVFFWSKGLSEPQKQNKNNQAASYMSRYDWRIEYSLTSIDKALIQLIFFMLIVMLI